MKKKTKSFFSLLISLFAVFVTSFIFSSNAQAFTSEVVEGDSGYVLEIYSGEVGEAVNAVTIVVDATNARFTDLTVPNYLIGPIGACNPDSNFSDNQACFSVAAINNFDVSMLLAELEFEIVDSKMPVVFTKNAQSEYASIENRFSVTEGELLTYDINNSAPSLPNTGGEETPDVSLKLGALVLAAAFAMVLSGVMVSKKDRLSKKNKQMSLGLIVVLILVVFGLGYSTYSDLQTDPSDVSVSDVKLPKGSACTEDKQCEGAKCSPQGVCGGLGAVCNGDTQEIRNQKCYQSKCSPNNVCGGNGAACRVTENGVDPNEKCLSGLCENEQCIASSTVDKKEKGEACTFDQECKASKCSPQGVCGGLGAFCDGETQEIRNQKCYKSKCSPDGICGGVGAACRATDNGVEPADKCLSSECVSEKCTFVPSCSSDGDCLGERYCSENVCQSKKDDGFLCDADNECKSDSCVENKCVSITVGEPLCPNIDVAGANGPEPDEKLTLVDFAAFARVYNTLCYNGSQYSSCGSVDTNSNNSVDLPDFSYFARHYGDDKTCVKLASN